MSWTAPSTAGKPPISGYDVQYQASGGMSWTSHSFSGTGTSTTISSLDAATTYNVQVKAKNDEGDQGWSTAGSGATKSRPVFTNQATTATVRENSAGGTAVATILATDADTGDTVTHSLDSTSDALFDINSSSGAITVQSNADLNFEGTNSYPAIVTATDGTNSATHNVTISVTDVNEPPSAPGRPTVSSVSTNSVRVSWTAPDMTGKPPITDYDVRFRVTNSGESWFLNDSVHPIPGTNLPAPPSTATSRTISGIGQIGVNYDFQVQAKNHEGSSGWSASGVGRTSNVTATIAAGTSPVTEGTAATFTVTIDPVLTTDIRIGLDVEDAEGSDFVATRHESSRQSWFNVPINAGDATATYSVPTLDDIVDEPNGPVTVRIRPSSDYTVGSSSSASVTVNDDDHTPAFTNQPTTASVPENSAGGAAVVTVRATDADTGDTVTHSLDGASDSVFDIDGSSGAITVGNGSTLDYESPADEFRVTVTATDGTNSSTHRVTISVTNVREPPDAPAPPTVTAVSTSSVDVSWVAPDVTGKPPTFGYNVQYRVSGATDWTAHEFAGTATFTRISRLSASTTYEVQVQARNIEGDSGWSDAGSGRTNTPPITNVAPVFDSPPSSVEVAEDSEDGVAVATIAATDGDGDTLSYALDSTSDTVFDIDSASGAITVQVEEGAALDHEATPSFAAVVTVSDGSVEVTHSLAIAVTDVDEPPDAPEAPTVTVASATSVEVAWTAPDPAGKPPVTDYDVQYRALGASAWTDASHDGAGTATTISGLIEGVAYEARVRATNDEGTGDWSEAGSDAAATPTEPAPPPSAGEVSGSTVTLEFDEPLDAQSVPDPEDFTVTVGGAAAFAGAGAGTGFRPASPLQAAQAQVHRVTAVSIEGFALSLTVSPPVPAGQTVTVSYTRGAKPLRTAAGTQVRAFTQTLSNVPPEPATAPEFDGGPTLMLTVAENSAAGALLGAVSATDADGDVPIYSLSSAGGEHESFAIDGEGRIRVADGAVLDFEVRSTYVFTVEVTDGEDAQGKVEDMPTADDSIGVTVTLTNVQEPPGEPEGLTVSAASSTSLQVAWTASGDAGARLDGYGVQYRVSGETQWTDHPHSDTATRTTIGDLLAGTAYEVRVRSLGDGDSEWAAAEGRTAATAPEFDGGPTLMLTVAENSAAGALLGAVSATDADGDVPIYSLSSAGGEHESFAIDGEGRIRVADGVVLDFEARSTYAFTAEVTDGEDAAGQRRGHAHPGRHGRGDRGADQRGGAAGRAAGT